MQRRTAAIAGIAALGAAALIAAPAAFAGDGSPSSGTAKTARPPGDGAKALCQRAPKVDRRIERALRRLDAGDRTPGSIARLDKRVRGAEKAGHEEIATFLRNKLTFRKSLVPTLEQRQKDLKAVMAWCATHSDGGAS